MDAAVSIAIRRWRIDGVCRRQTPMPKSGMDAGFRHAQGIEAVSFLPEAKKIQADSPVPGGAGDAPGITKIRKKLLCEPVPKPGWFWPGSWKNRAFDWFFP
jgi:hypothetical protein